MSHSQQILRVFLGVIFVLGLTLGHVTFAQTSTVVFTSDPTLPALSTELDIEASDLGVENPNFFSVFRRRFVRFFTRNSVKRAKLDLEIANLTLLRARQALLAGNTERAQTLLDQYNQQIIAVSSTVQAMADQVGTADPNVAALLAQITNANVLQSAALDNMSLKATGDFNKKILRVRLDVMKELAKLLTKENLTPEKLAKRLDELAKELAEKEADQQKKLLKRLALGEELDEATEDEDLEEAIDEHENEIEDEIAELDDDEIEEIADEVEDSFDNHLVVLQALLDKVPATAKPAIQGAIDRILAKVKEDAAKDPAVLGKLLREKDKRHREVMKKLIERLRETLKDDEEARKELEEEDDELDKVEDEESSEDNSGSDSDSDSDNSGPS